MVVVDGKRRQRDLEHVREHVRVLHEDFLHQTSMAWAGLKEVSEKLQEGEEERSE